MSFGQILKIYFGIYLLPIQQSYFGCNNSGNQILPPFHKVCLCFLLWLHMFTCLVFFLNYFCKIMEFLAHMSSKSLFFCYFSLCSATVFTDFLEVQEEKKKENSSQFCKPPFLQCLVIIHDSDLALTSCSP